MSYTRRNTNKDATWARAWTADTYADLASIAAIVGTEAPHHGDIAYVSDEDLYYFWLDNGTWNPLYTLNIGNVLVISGINYKFYKQTSDTDSARGIALVNATNAAIAGDVIIIGPGNYSITSAIAILDNQIIELKSSTIYNTTNNTDLFQVTSKIGWRLQGTGWLQGAGIGVGGIITDQAGIRVSGTDSFPANWHITGLSFKDFKGAGIAIMSASSGATGGKISNVLVTNSTYGLYDIIGAEYLQVDISEFYANTTGLYIAGGNFTGTNISIVSNDTGVYLDSGVNHGHGQLIGCEINHNSIYTVYANSITIGFDFIGCHYYPTGGAPIFIHESYGLQFIGGQIGTITFNMDGVFSGYNFVRDMWFENGEPTLSGSVANLIIHDCFTTTGLTSNSNTPYNPLIVANTGLQIYDTDASNLLTIVPGSNLTANRTLTITTGDANRTITLSGSPTLANWFDQSVKTTVKPTFAGVTLTSDSSIAGGLTFTGTPATYGIDIQQVQAKMNFQSTTGTLSAYFQWQNTSGGMFAGVDNSTGGNLATGSTAYAGVFSTYVNKPLEFGTNNTIRGRFAASGEFELLKTLSKYNNIATAGNGIPSIYASGRSTAQTAAVATVTTYTVGSADASFDVCANVNVTASTTHNIAVQVDYTDETNTARTLTLSFSQLAGTIVTAITNVTGAGPYEGISNRIRCKASTSITIKTTGTFTSVTYNVEGTIIKIA